MGNGKGSILYRQECMNNKSNKNEEGSSKHLSKVYEKRVLETFSTSAHKLAAISDKGVWHATLLLFAIGTIISLIVNLTFFIGVVSDDGVGSSEHDVRIETVDRSELEKTIVTIKNREATYEALKKKSPVIVDPS